MPDQPVVTHSAARNWVSVRRWSCSHRNSLSRRRLAVMISGELLRSNPPHPRRTRPRRHPRALPRQPKNPIPQHHSPLLPTGGLAAWPASAPLFVGGDGQRITRGTLQYRALRAFRQAGIDSTRAKGALLHGLRTPSPPNWPTPTSAFTP